MRSRWRSEWRCRSLVVAPILRPEPIGAIGAYWATPHLATTAEITALEHLAALGGEALERFPEGIPARGIGHQVRRLVPKAHKAPSARATTT